MFLTTSCIYDRIANKGIKLCQMHPVQSLKASIVAVITEFVESVKSKLPNLPKRGLLKR